MKKINRIALFLSLLCCAHSLLCAPCSFKKNVPPPINSVILINPYDLSSENQRAMILQGVLDVNRELLLIDKNDNKLVKSSLNDSSLNFAQIQKMGKQLFINNKKRQYMRQYKNWIYMYVRYLDEVLNRKNLEVNKEVSDNGFSIAFGDVADDLVMSDDLSIK